MKKKEEKTPKIRYYTDEKNDDFAGTNIKPKVIDKKYKYIHKNPVWNFFSFLVYYVIGVPIVWFHTKLYLNIKYVNKKNLKKVKQPYFLYGNHTSYLDAFTPNVLSLPKKNRIIVSPETVSINGTKTLIKLLGALPIPTNLSGMRHYTEALEYYHTKKKNNIVIYPEAHIWPYYTGIRDFPSTSFLYPIKYNSPVFAFFTAYTKPTGIFKKLKKANITVYVSEPFYPNKDLKPKEAEKELRDKVYEFMKDCSTKYSTYDVIKYVKKEEENEEVH